MTSCRPVWLVGATTGLLSVALALSACALAPRGRPDTAAAAASGVTGVTGTTGATATAAPSARSVAAGLSVVGRNGRLNPAERTRLLQRLGAQGDAPLVQRHLLALQTLGTLDLYAGNETLLLEDGPSTYAAMFAAIGQARRSVLLESYIIDSAETAQRLAALLATKRAEGVTVAVIYDGLGSLGTDPAFFNGLRQTGVAVCEFNPLNPIKTAAPLAGSPGAAQVAAGAAPAASAPGWDPAHRDHRKLLVIDREVGFIGGINISAVYTSGSFAHRLRRPERAESGVDTGDGWRDTQVRLRGPAVAALDDLVRQTWQRQACADELPAAPATAGAPKAGPGAASTLAGVAAGNQVVRIVPAGPDDPVNLIYASLLTSIDVAQRSIYLTMAYFAPGQALVESLAEAARRGVDVQLVLPSVSDFSPVLHAGRSHYQTLLNAGVKIHELQGVVLHAKTAVIDGVVSSVGSSNLDGRSLGANEEVNAAIIGDEFGQAMTRMFRRDVAASKPITLADWQARPVLQRVKERLAGWLERWW